jgi:tryptophan 7-halogenase
MSKPLDVVILGGGTAGWMCAVALARAASGICRVRLVESEEIGSVGVGEATLPQMKEFNDYIGINEADMMRKTGATFKLGIEFVSWGKLGVSYIHPFGTFGESFGGVEFHQQWMRLGQPLPLEAYSYAIQACRNNRFEFPVETQSAVNSTYSYAYHFDAGLYSKYLRSVAEKEGVERLDGILVEVKRSNDGGIEHLLLRSGEIVRGDFFIDCSGFRSLLLGKELQAEFEDWSPWLVCDRAVAVASESVDRLLPYTRSTAKSAGWQWRIPLQHRIGNGYVFASEFISEDEAVENLLSTLESPSIGTPKLLKFKAGRYKSCWQKNCVAIGLSSGFLEPLESTSIYLIQIAITNLLKLFPSAQESPALIAEFNRLMDVEYGRIRDFLILHYYLNQRDDSELWRYCRAMTIPESLKYKLTLFRQRGYIADYQYGLFNLPSWLAVLNGQGASQESVDPFAFFLAEENARQKLDLLSKKIDQRVQIMPDHRQFIADYCLSSI